MATQTTDGERRRTAHKVLLALVFALSFAVYLLTLAPGLTWAHHGADGGDLITAAYTLGVPHPPGYPTYSLLAWLFTRLPLGNVAWRVNLLSALSTATAAALIYWIVARVAPQPALRPAPGTALGRGDADKVPKTPAIIAGLGTGLSYAFAPLVWSQALIAEVYALSGFWTALVLYWTTLRPDSRNGPRCTFILGLLWSLGLGIHLTLVLLAPLVIWSIGNQRPAVSRRWSAVTSVGFLSGSLVWLYLPLRAGRGGVTWGQPTSLGGGWWLISGALYRDYVFALPASAWGERLRAWAQTWTSGLGLIGVGLALWGVIWLASGRRGFGPRLRREASTARLSSPKSEAQPGGCSAERVYTRAWLMATGMSFVALNLYALGYNTADSVVYLIPAFVIGCLWLGVGAADLFNRMHEWGTVGFGQQQTLPLDGTGQSKVRWLTPLVLIIALAPSVWTLSHNRAALDLSDDHSAESFGYAVMNDAPLRAVLLTTTDRQTFALWYYQQVKGQRSDVVVVDEGLWGFDWYRTSLQQTHPDLEIGQADTWTTMAQSAKRPRCRVRREADSGWLDCQD